MLQTLRAMSYQTHSNFRAAKLHHSRIGLWHKVSAMALLQHTGWGDKLFRVLSVYLHSPSLIHVFIFIYVLFIFILTPFPRPGSLSFTQSTHFTTSLPWNSPLLPPQTLPKTHLALCCLFGSQSWHISMLMRKGV